MPVFTGMTAKHRTVYSTTRCQDSRKDRLFDSSAKNKNAAGRISAGGAASPNPKKFTR